MSGAGRSRRAPHLLQVVYGAKRRATVVTDRLVHRMNRLRRDPLTGLPQATCDFFRVLDGRTLQLHAVLPGLPRDRQYRAELRFVRQRSVRPVPAVIRQGQDGQFAVEAMVPLGHDPDEVPLTRGTWSMALHVTATGEPERQFSLRVAEPVDPAGPTVATPPHPVSGHHFRPGRGARGLAHLTVTAAQARAEVIRLETGPADARVRARLVGTKGSGVPQVVFSARGGGSDVVVPVEPLAGGAFELVVPLAQLARDAAGEEVVWEAWVRISSTQMIRLGRYLHDLRNPRAVLSASRTVLAIDDQTLVAYRPYYTSAGNLAVACLRFARFTEVPS